MRVGVFQFSGSSNITDNYKAIIRAIEGASQNKVRLLVFQECATCGYPPVETPKVENIDFQLLYSFIHKIRLLAKKMICILLWAQLEDNPLNTTTHFI
jgi:predicted amidohydrolase